LLRYYPLKSLAGVDNTCRAPVGFNVSNQSSFCQPDPSSASKKPPAR
jgi:hypothetical protein